MRRLAIVVACGLAAGLAVAEPAAVLTLHYQERAPYSVLEADGRVTGRVATPAARALERAGIAFEWRHTPAQRQLALIQQGNGLHCGVGWFHTPQREAAGRFSVALYRDRPFVALVRADLATPAAVAAADLLASPSRLLVKDGYSYGTALDALIAGAATPALRVAADVGALARMVAAGRADWMIASGDEVPVLLAAVPRSLPAPRVVRLRDAPDGPTRHLYCNLAVPPAWMARIDRALAEATP